VWDELGEFEQKMGPRVAATDKADAKAAESSDAGGVEAAGLGGNGGESVEADRTTGMKGEEDLEEAQAEVEEAEKECEEMEKRHKEGRDLIWRKGLGLNVELAKAKHLKETIERGMREAKSSTRRTASGPAGGS